MKLAVCILVAVLAVVVAAAGNKPGYCHFQGIDIKEGETIPAPIGKCHSITCNDASKNSVSSITCPPSGLSPESTCYQDVMDLTVAFPDCCPLTLCP